MVNVTRWGLQRNGNSRQSAAELVAIVCRDASLDEEPIGYVRASVRAALLDRYPVESATPHAPMNVRRCTICEHPQRDALEAALAGGSSYREVAARSNVSRSALSRHAGHAG